MRIERAASQRHGERRGDRCDPRQRPAIPRAIDSPDADREAGRPDRSARRAREERRRRRQLLVWDVGDGARAVLRRIRDAERGVAGRILRALPESPLDASRLQSTGGQRRELEAARESLRRELGCEPSLADLAARVGSDEKRLGRTIVRINAIESTSPLANNDRMDESSLPTALVPSEPERPDAAYEREQTKSRVRAAIASLPKREQKVIALYYYAEATMKQIGGEIGVNESRVSQLHARAGQCGMRADRRAYPVRRRDLDFVA